MAPYAGENSTTMMVNTREELHDAYYEADTTKPITGSNDQTADDATTAESTDGSTSGNNHNDNNKFDFVFDFNPCQTMSSAFFKERTCYYCAQKCSKVRFYLSLFH
jgi:hypothetical protein